jgi:hypothetical protein
VKRLEPTFWVDIYMAGDIWAAKTELRRECNREGLCVTLTPTEFIYTGGLESGFVVGLKNYPRFPKAPAEIMARARVVADGLLLACGQQSYMLVTPLMTEWVSHREEDKSGPA